MLSPLVVAAGKPCFEGKKVPVVVKSRAGEQAKLKQFAEALRKNDAGMRMLMALAGGALVVDVDRAPDGFSAFAECSSLVTDCFDPKNGRQLDDCMASVPVCASQKPWLEPNFCCPKKCIEAYDSARCKGVKDADAYMQLFAQKPSCE